MGALFTVHEFGDVFSQESLNEFFIFCYNDKREKFKTALYLFAAGYKQRNLWIVLMLL
jgi:hypothetical protein